MFNPKTQASRYKALKKLGSSDLKGNAVGETLLAMATDGFSHLCGLCSQVELSSRVPHKKYVAFKDRDQVSRPVNVTLFEHDRALELAEQFIKSAATLTAAECTRAAYTIAMSVLAANDVVGVGRKASATFFEVLIGHAVAHAIQVNPSTRVRMPEDQNISLPTDYVFDLGASEPKIHLPVKTSTRERIVQAWVHQLILERIFGTGVYRGMLVVIGETKRDAKSNAVVEICIPGQLRIFQARIAKLDRIYYLDPPDAYLALSKARPNPVEVRSFGEFFSELRSLTEF